MSGPYYYEKDVGWDIAGDDGTSQYPPSSTSTAWASTSSWRLQSTETATTSLSPESTHKSSSRHGSSSEKSRAKYEHPHRGRKGKETASSSSSSSSTKKKPRDSQDQIRAGLPPRPAFMETGEEHFSSDNLPLNYPHRYLEAEEIRRQAQEAPRSVPTNGSKGYPHKTSQRDILSCPAATGDGTYTGGDPGPSRIRYSKTTGEVHSVVFHDRTMPKRPGASEHPFSEAKWVPRTDNGEPHPVIIDGELRCAICEDLYPDIKNVERFVHNCKDFAYPPAA